MLQEPLQIRGLKMLIITLDMLLEMIMIMPLPLPRLEMFKRIPLCSLPAAWNTAGDIRFQQNKTTFRIALKDKLLGEIEPDAT
jgi:hypothetical protein